jgi:hypothetical protein
LENHKLGIKERQSVLMDIIMVHGKEGRNIKLGKWAMLG